MAARQDVSDLLSAWRGGNRGALDRLFPVVYAELRNLARRELAREAPGRTLDSGALVHEVYIKLAGQSGLEWRSRAQFFAIAARSMRTILIDCARRRARAKRGGGAASVPLERLERIPAAQQDEHLLALDAALSQLASIDAVAGATVEYRYFGGLTLEEIAAVLGVSVSTVRRRWEFAKAWLQRDLGAAG